MGSRFPCLKVVPRYLKLADLALFQERISGRQLFVGLYGYGKFVGPRNYGNWQHPDGNGQRLHLGLDPLRSNGDLVEVPDVVASVRGWAIAGNEFIEKVCKATCSLVKPKS